MTLCSAPYSIRAGGLGGALFRDQHGGGDAQEVTGRRPHVVGGAEPDPNAAGLGLVGQPRAGDLDHHRVADPFGSGHGVVSARHLLFAPCVQPGLACELLLDGPHNGLGTGPARALHQHITAPFLHLLRSLADQPLLVDPEY